MSAKNTAYAIVAGQLREDILSHRLRPGQQMPPERELCTQFSASRITIRRALQILEEELLIQRRQGSGTFVSPSPSRKIPLYSMDFSGSIAHHAPDLERRLHERKWQEAPPEIAMRLDLPPGEMVTFARRVDSLKGIPVTMDEAYLVGSLSDKLTDEDLERLKFLERWAGVHQLQFEYASQSLEALSAEPPISRLLGVSPKVPLLKEINVIHLVGGRRAGVFLSWYRHDYFRFEATFPIVLQTDNRKK